MSRSCFCCPDLNPSPLIFSKCQQCQLHKEKKYLHPSRSLIGFSILLKQSLYFHMALSYSAYATATLAYHLRCVIRWVCDAALWQQTLVYSQLKCGSVTKMQPTLGSSISSIAFYIFLTLSLTYNLHGPVAVYFTCIHHLLKCLFYMHCCFTCFAVLHALLQIGLGHAYLKCKSWNGNAQTESICGDEIVHGTENKKESMKYDTQIGIN